MLCRLLRASLFAGLAVLLMVTAVQAASRQNGDQTATTRTSSPANEPFAIFGDETYRRDGALTRFHTCLAIADDPRVQNVWDHPDFAPARDVPPYDLVDTLRGLPDSVRMQRGFGTVFACAYVVSTWYAKTIGNDPKQPFFNRYIGQRASDGRFEHGATVIDLGLGRDLRALIEPVALLRILTSPSLLPKASFGGIVLRNAIVNGPLVMHNLHLTSPLAFVNVKFVGRSFSKELFDNPRDTRDTAIAIAFSEFDSHVLFANSEICGKVNIRESHFRETLAFERVMQRTMGCQPLAPIAIVSESAPSEHVLSRANMSVWISSSRFDQSLSFVGTHLDFLRIVGNRIDSFLASTSEFGRHLRMWENDLGSIQINCSILAAKADISYNHIAKDLFVFGTRIQEGKYGTEGESCRDWWAKEQHVPEDYATQLKMTSNRIGGGLGLEDLDGALIKPPIDLSSNRVGNGSLIQLPSDTASNLPWRGVINLEGSNYEGKIELTRAPSSAVGWTSRHDDDYCAIHVDNPPTAATIDLSAARIRTLKWNLPLTCDYRWQGYGLTYDLWQAGGAARASANFKERIDDQSVLPFWRLMLDIYEPASLSAMSQYLDNKGSSVDSRRILLEAKRLNYAPACPPDWYTVFCPFSMDWPSVRERGQDASEQAAAGLASKGEAALQLVDVDIERDRPVQSLASIFDVFLSVASYLLSVLMLFFLWPGGYGAAPELAILLIVVLAAIFWWIYYRYSERLKSDLKQVPSYKGDISWMTTSSLADLPEHGKESPVRELGEKPARPFIHRAANQSQSRSESGEQTKDRPAFFPWPTEDEWDALGTTEKRLQVIQDILLPATRKRAEESEEVRHQQDLKTLRLKLEHFGNTETLGFSLFDQGRMPTRFTHWLYSIDTMLPFIDLHAYGNYYPESSLIRTCSVLQHIIGWWLITVFIASAAIL